MNNVAPHEELAALRATLEAVDKEIGQIQNDRRDAGEILDRKLEAWAVRTRFLRQQREGIVAGIRLASQKVRGITPRNASTDCFNPEPEKP